MSRSLEFDGWWEGEVVFSCDHCHKEMKFRFDDEESAKNAKEQREFLKNNQGWIMTKIGGIWHDFCCESCRNEYIKSNT